MADDENSGTDEEASGGGKKKLILLIIIALLLVAISAGGTFVAITMLGEKPQPAEGEEGEGGSASVVEDDKKSAGPAIYFPIKPPIIVNYAVKGRQRYAQVEVTLMTREEDVIAAIELHAPMITNALVLLIGGQSYVEIQTAEGKELLRQKCLQKIQELLQKEIDKPGVENVLFTNFVMQ